MFSWKTDKWISELYESVFEFPFATKQSETALSTLLEVDEGDTDKVKARKEFTYKWVNCLSNKVKSLVFRENEWFFLNFTQSDFKKSDSGIYIINLDAILSIFSVYNWSKQ